MLKKLFLFLVLATAFFAVNAQTTVSGNVFDYENKSFPLEKVAVKNLATKSLSFSDEKGRFTIPAKMGDLLEFMLAGYRSDTLFLIDLKGKTIFLLPRTIDVAGVEIKETKISPLIPLKDPEAKEYKRFATDDLHNKGNFDRAGGLTMSLGFGKYRREQAKLAELNEREQFDEEIRKNFNDKSIHDLLKLTGQELKDFIDMFRPTYAQVKSQRPFNYQFYTVQAYHAWLKLPPEQRKLQPLPKLKGNP